MGIVEKLFFNICCHLQCSGGPDVGGQNLVDVAGKLHDCCFLSGVGGCASKQMPIQPPYPPAADWEDHRCVPQSLSVGLWFAARLRSLATGGRIPMLQCHHHHFFCHLPPSETPTHTILAHVGTSIRGGLSKLDHWLNLLLLPSVAGSPSSFW